MEDEVQVRAIVYPRSWTQHIAIQRFKARIKGPKCSTMTLCLPLTFLPALTSVDPRTHNHLVPLFLVENAAYPTSACKMRSQYLGILAALPPPRLATLQVCSLGITYSTSILPSLTLASGHSLRTRGGFPSHRLGKAHTCTTSGLPTCLEHQLISSLPHLFIGSTALGTQQ